MSYYYYENNFDLRDFLTGNWGLLGMPGLQFKNGKLGQIYIVQICCSDKPDQT